MMQPQILKTSTRTLFFTAFACFLSRRAASDQKKEIKKQNQSIPKLDAVEQLVVLHKGPDELNHRNDEGAKSQGAQMVSKHVPEVKLKNESQTHTFLHSSQFDPAPPPQETHPPTLVSDSPKICRGTKLIAQ